MIAFNSPTCDTPHCDQRLSPLRLHLLSFIINVMAFEPVKPSDWLTRCLVSRTVDLGVGRA